MSTPCTRRRFERAVRDLFIKGPTAPTPNGLSEHLQVCAECRSLFSGLALAERSLAAACGAEADLSPLEVEIGWRGLADRARLPAPGRSFGPLGVLVPAGLALAAVLVILGLSLRGGSNHETADRHDALAARGVQATPSLQLVCIRPEGTPRAHPAVRTDGRAACGLDEILGFTYLNPGGKFRGLALLSVDGRGGRNWYLPNPADPGPYRLAPADRPTALERTVRIGVNHHPGLHRVVALFTEEPVDLARAREAVGGWLERGATPPGAILVERELDIQERAQ